MNTTIEKRVYTQPAIESIQLDNEISLALESSPPVGPFETNNNSPEFINSNPIKTHLG